METDLPETSKDVTAKELFNDLFDHFDQDDDNYEDIGDLDFMMSIKLDGVEEEEEDPLSDGNDEKEEEEEEEQVLSQRLSQLSTSKKEENEMAGPVLKKMRKDEEEEKNLIDTIPKYLSPTNKSFRKMLEQKAWFKNNRNHNEEDLRYLTILMHKLAVVTLQKDLWTKHAHSGMGQLKKKDTNESMTTNGPSVWPVKVKSFILSKRTTTEMKSDDEHQACLDVVYRFIFHLHIKYQQYHQQLIDKKKSYINYTDSIEKDLQTFIEQHGVYVLRLKCDLKQALVNNDYQDQMFQIKYRQLNPNDYQKQIAQHLYDLKYNFEKAHQQVTLLKQRMSYNKPPNSFHSIDLNLPATFQNINDATIRQRLLDRQTKIIQQTKTDMMAMLINGAEAT